MAERNVSGANSDTTLGDSKTSPEQVRGWLLKWTNYIKGYQKRWFVLSGSVLSYYRTQEEMVHTCRGTINLEGALIDIVDSTNFVVSNGPSQVYYLRTVNKPERQRWVTAIGLAKSKAVKNIESDGSDSDAGTEDEGGEDALTILKNKLKHLTAANELVMKNSHQLLGQITDTGEGVGHSKLKEKLALFKITANALVKAAVEFTDQAQGTERRWSRLLQHERSMRQNVEENMKTLASQCLGLENEASKAAFLRSQSSSTSVRSSDLPMIAVAEQESRKDRVTADGDDFLESDEEKFYDAPGFSQEEVDELESSQSEALQSGQRTSVISLDETVPSQEQPKLLPVGADRAITVPIGPGPAFFENVRPTLELRRTTVPPKPQYRFNLWNLMKNFIGKDLSKIPMPVHIFEPLSFIQRMVESLVYSGILDQAAACTDSLEQMAYMASFASSSYASTTIRLGKPFNPLLGETFECDRRAEYGWRVIAEQVSHHPPMYAMHAEHKDWTLWEEYTVSSKFRGKYVACTPIGYTHVVFHKTGHHYTYNRPLITVHNIIVGRLWVDQSGEVKVVNHTTSEECCLKFSAWSYFSRERQRKVKGYVKNVEGSAKYSIHGYWDDYLELSEIIKQEGSKMVTAPAVSSWKAVPPQPGNEHIYAFSEFACSLNELEEGIAPTDSRLRPDERIMENGDFDKANIEKERLEEKQRAKRKKREIAAAKAAEAAAAGNHEDAARLQKEASYYPMWFEKEFDPATNSMTHMYKGGYWEAKQSGNWGKDLPDIF